ncbi:XRE family transcriptional regulator [Streptomyces sp. NPDC059578]|uniref:XRE family transcriptional regulator n=1 Tax=Streptomyces sp. NPDC059578 TaxID=3346874 RepID=UPI0036C617C4
MPQPNYLLARRLADIGLKQAELARQANTEIELLTGRPGSVTDADVRRWLRGQTRWPQDRIRICLEKVLGASAEDLGFVPRKKRTEAPEEDPVHRRRFFFTAGGSAVAVGAFGPGSPSRLGVNDVRLFHQDYVVVLRHDNAGRGFKETEDLALELAARIRSALTVSTTSIRVQTMLYRLSAEVMTSAAFASIDASAPRRARAHLDQALSFAGLSRDGEALYHVWNHMTLASSQRENHAEAVAGAEVMKRSSIARRDPLYASLGHLRNANGLARLQRRSEALRALGDAERAFVRATDQQRPEWINFYDGSELDALSSFMWAALGEHGRSEYCLHRTLAAIPKRMIRNRALYTAHLSLAQARQGELELACSTGRQVYRMLPSSSRSRRTARTLAATRRALVASGSKSRDITEWIEEFDQWN